MSDVKEAVMAFFEKSSAKGKKRLAPKDVAKAMVDDFPKKKETKLAIQALIEEEKLSYWSSGSTTYVMLKQDYDELMEATAG